MQAIVKQGNFMELEIYNQVKTTVKRLLNIDLTHYKDEQMRRRLDAWLVRSDISDWGEYFKRISRDDHELLRFRNYLTINVSEFFRDLDRWNYLKTEFLPVLLRESRKFHPALTGLRAWSCGCSLGQEVYSLSMLLTDEAPALKHELLATDIDRGALAVAKARGPYGPDNLAGVSRAQLEKYFDLGGPPFYIRKETARIVAFREQNMITDPFETNYDLIICRNAIIYFTQEAKEGLYRKFYQALRPGGVLFLGGTEIIPHAQDTDFQSRGYSFYIKG
jgi:chemotaxis protein methyltransferase CheR